MTDSIGYAAPMEEGFIQSMDFVYMNPPHKTFSIIRPAEGAIFTGEVGCDIFFQVDFPLLNELATQSLPILTFAL